MRDVYYSELLIYVYDFGLTSHEWIVGDGNWIDRLNCTAWSMFSRKQFYSFSFIFFLPRKLSAQNLHWFLFNSCYFFSFFSLFLFYLQPLRSFLIDVFYTNHLSFGIHVKSTQQKSSFKFFIGIYYYIRMAKQTPSYPKHSCTKVFLLLHSFEV